MKSVLPIPFCSCLLLFLVPIHAPAADNPILDVQEPLLGAWTFTAPTSALVPVDVPAGAMLHFSWTADASPYGGTVEGYRYGLDVVDPDDPYDPGWVTGFQPDLLAAAPILFEGGVHSLHVVARDVAGATTRAAFELTARCPVLTLSEPELGTWIFTTPTSPNRQFTVVRGEPLDFSWLADASSYGGAIAGYRYGWDLVDPDDPDDPGWATPLQADLLSAPTQAFTAGSHLFCVVARDAAGAETRGCIAVVVDDAVSARISTWAGIKAIYGR